MPMMVHAADVTEDITNDVPEMTTPDMTSQRTPCATAVMNAALINAGGNISDDAPEFAVRDWIYQTLNSVDITRQILACPEVANTPPTETIIFDPVIYTFPSGRTITMQRETQPHVLGQRLLLATQRHLPHAPFIGADGATWTNTDPAWYGIMVVQSGTLNDFVGPGRANTISLDYIRDNIDYIYPRNTMCTSRTALADDNEMINIAVHETVSMDDDSNDYYVAGDANLQWITWGEVALDAAITLATVGGGAVILGATKGARATRAAKNLVGVIKNLERTDDVRDYIRATQEYTRMTESLKNIDRVADATRHADLTRDIERVGQQIRNAEQTENVKKYQRATSAFDDVMKYRSGLKSLRSAQRGNIIARTMRAARAANTGNKTIKRAARAGRASTQSGRVRDWLFQSTLKNAGKLAKVTEATGIIYGAMKFVGDMYDWTETSTGEFTNGLQFSPLCLLSADDLAGQENVVNHGMWLMWAGDSVTAADDDAAFLQAMDFAAKFHSDLMDTMDAHNNHACDVDIFVVRPVIRNPGDASAGLYYLIMNDEPWSTRP